MEMRINSNQRTSDRIFLSLIRRCSLSVLQEASNLFLFFIINILLIRFLNTKYCTFSIKADIICNLFLGRSGEHAGEYKIRVSLGSVKKASFLKESPNAFFLMAGRSIFYFSNSFDRIRRNYNLLFFLYNHL